ncbi:MAG: family efflux transporter, subunit [Bryobacterales bacterium]|nr:family efflux transporter, subunit [Bryobacterales bacterium]
MTVQNSKEFTSEAATGSQSHLTQPHRVSRKVMLAIFVMLAAALLIALAIAIIPRVRLKNQLAAQKEQRAATPPNVFVIPAQPSPASVKLQLTGTMAPVTEAPILAQVDGYLKTRLVDIGDRVHEGQLLALISDPALDQQVQQAKAMLQQSQSTLQQAQAALDEAKANAGLASITAQRWATLLKRGAVSQQANDNYQFAYNAQTAAVNVAAANVAAAKDSVGSNQANLGRYLEQQSFERVTAPFTGVVTQRNVDVGTLITANSTLLYRVAKYDVLRTYVDVPQLHTPSVKVGDSAAVSVVDYPNQTFEGKVTRFSDSLNLNTRTLLTEVDVRNPGDVLLPGMYATVNFALPRAVTAMIVPEESMIFRAKGTLLATVDDQHAVHFQNVVLGHDYGTSLEILSGLKTGQLVIVSPNDSVVEGAKVNPVLVKDAPASMSPAGHGASSGTEVSSAEPSRSSGATQEKK